MDTYKTLNDVVDDYEVIYANTYKASTIAMHRYAYNLYVKPFFGDCLVKDIDTVMVFKWWDEIVEGVSTKGTPYTVKTINCFIRPALSVYLNLAVRLGYIERNPMVAVPKYRNPNSVPTKSDNFIEASDFFTFISCVDDELYYNLFYLLFFTGARIGEMFCLTWEDVDFINRKININKTIRYVSKELGVMITPPKTKNSIRIIEVSFGCLEILQSMFDKASKKVGFSYKNFVFGNDDHLKYNNTRKKFNYYLNKSGVKKITLHGLRHSHASMLINNGVQDYLVAQRLGHSVKELHETYAHIFSSKQKELEPILDSIEKDTMISN